MTDAPLDDDSPRPEARRDPMPPDTARLVDAVRGGDGASFGSLYARIAPALLVWARLRIRPALAPWLDPEDLVQEVCCRAFASFPNFDPSRGVFRAWIFGIANVVLKHALQQLGRAPPRQRGQRSEEGTQLLEQVPDDATSVTRRLARDEDLLAFGQRLATLPEDDRMLLLCRGLEGMPHDEVAERLGENVEVVKKRWQRLRARLQDQWGSLVDPER